MPYNHPVLGVPVMTMGEFWASEAKKEGKDTAEIMGDFYDEMAQDCIREQERLKNHPEELLAMLKDYCEADPEASEFQPVEILTVDTVSVSFGFSKDTTEFTVEVKCSDGKVRTLEYSQTCYAGTLLDPPDFDSNCVVIDVA